MRNGHSPGTPGPQPPVTTPLPRGPVDRVSAASRPHRRRWTPAPGSERRLIPLDAAAAYLGLSPWTVRELTWKGKLPAVRLVRKLLYDRRDLDRLIDEAKA